MKMTLVTYRKTFNLGSYTSESIGVEMELNEGDSAVEALDNCSNLVEEYHQKTLASLEEYRGTHIKTISGEQEQQVEKVPEKTMIEQMEDCGTFDEIYTFRFTVKNDAEKLVYETKLNELSPKK